MTDRLPTTWPRDWPVLLAAARAIEEGREVHDNHLARVTGMDLQTTVLALRALNGTYLVADIPGGERGTVTGLTERGRRITGLWPSSDGLDGLADLLKAAEDTTNDPEEKSLLRRAAAAVYGVSRDIGTDVAAAWFRAQAGL